MNPRATLKNENGQMAIFVALIFQVLFVFFAMAINVSLMVHDKINLQNATDLAAYYAAAKQAEMLNAMAHVNYQIRQGYKLMAWRYRVVGTLGLAPSVGSIPPTEFHPSVTNSLNETEWRFGAVTSTANKVQPQICVNFSPSWKTDAEIAGHPGFRIPGAPSSGGEQENACKGPNFNIPELPIIESFANWVAINPIIESFSQQLQADFVDSCASQGVWNWWYTRAVMHAYRRDQANRRQLIHALANTMALPGEQMLDIDGNSVSQGAFTTLSKNLTFTNSAGELSFRLHNSMEGLNRKAWLQEIFVAPTQYWTDFQGFPACNSVPKNFNSPPNTSHPQALNHWNQINASLAGNVLQGEKHENFPDNDAAMRMTVGYEKNPWVMAYVGVEASTTSRNIFHPFGGPVTIVAKSYAKPFGGRFGPWYTSSWPSSAFQSTGGEKVDLRGQPRTDVNSGLPDDQQDPDRVPNYSRFPGDTLGLASRLAQGALNNLRGLLKTDLNYYRDIYRAYTPGQPNDPLAWDVRRNNVPQPNTRQYELMAIAPDLFDITYYSIEPNFWGNYGARIQGARSVLGIPDNLVIRPDLGYRAGRDDFAAFSVSEQIAGAPLLHPNAFYHVRRKEHFLTGWIPGPTANVYFPETEGGGTPANDPGFPFGQCPVSDSHLDPSTGGPTNPGSCLSGGRTGYSVKLISKDYLNSSEFELGGEGAGQAGIQNPPIF